jgi:[calcium/calmodulin-dependent protein kinase] kinase
MESEENNNPKKIIETDIAEIKYEETTGNKIVNEFLFKETLGRGAYSKVKKCINTKTNEEFAVKILHNYLLRKKKKAFDKTNEGSLLIHYMIEDALNEIKTYKAIPKNHPNILSLYQIINDKEKDKTYLIMELAEQGSLVTLDEKTGVFTLNKNYDNSKYDEKLIKSWILDIASGLKFLHDNNIAHCDIKSDNIVLGKDGKCKLADFGNSMRINEGDKDNFIRTQGNIYFFPPELVEEKEKEKEEKKSIDYKPVDIWMLGVSIYTCIYKCLPFVPEVRDNIIELFKEISNANFDYKKNGIIISDEMKTLLEHILEKDPEKRFTADDILNYPWLKE